MRRLKLDFKLPLKGGQKVLKTQRQRIEGPALKGKLCTQKVRVTSRKELPDKAPLAPP